MKRTFRVMATNGLYVHRPPGGNLVAMRDPGPELELEEARKLGAEWRDCGYTSILKPVWPSSSLDVSRSQLIGMLAALRGILVDFTNDYGASPMATALDKLMGSDYQDLREAICQGKELIELTGFDLDDADAIEGGFDKSWHFEDAPATRDDSQRAALALATHVLNHGPIRSIWSSDARLAQKTERLARAVLATTKPEVWRTEVWGIVRITGRDSYGGFEVEVVEPGPNTNDRVGSTMILSASGFTDGRYTRLTEEELAAQGLDCNGMRKQR